jgi:hypothetical protein
MWFACELEVHAYLLKCSTFRRFLHIFSCSCSPVKHRETVRLMVDFLYDLLSMLHYLQKYYMLRISNNMYIQYYFLDCSHGYYYCLLLIEYFVGGRRNL